MPKATGNETATPIAGGRVARLKPVGRFLAWWFSFFALLGPLSACPVCGQPGCPGGAASAGILGGLLAMLTFIPGRLRRLFRKSQEGDAGAK